MTILEKAFAMLVSMAILSFFAIFLIAAVTSHEQTRPDFRWTIRVDDSSKVPQAITNAVECIQAKGFILTNLTLEKEIFGKTITVTAGGKDLGNILKID